MQPKRLLKSNVRQKSNDTKRNSIGFLIITALVCMVLYWRVRAATHVGGSALAKAHTEAHAAGPGAAALEGARAGADAKPAAEEDAEPEDEADEEDPEDEADEEEEEAASDVPAVSGAKKAGRGGYPAPHVPSPEFVYGGSWAAHRKQARLTDTQTFACHATTVLHLQDGKVMMAWFGGTYEGAEDVGIWTSVRDPKHGWSKPLEAAKVFRNAKYNGKNLKENGPYKMAEPARKGREPHWNPVLWCADSASSGGGDGAAAGPCTGEIILYFKVGWKIPEWQTFETRSKDGGRTWAKAHELVAGDHGGRGPVKNKPILLANGKWAAPASLENALGHKKRAWRGFVDFSSDGGHSWTMGPIVMPDNNMGSIQPTVWESKPGHLHMLMRSSRGNRAMVWKADSTDGGKTWSKPVQTKLPNNNSGLDVARMPHSGTLVLAYNPTSDADTRYPLQLAISDDNGATWKVGWDADVEHGDVKTQGHEYSYPACVPWPSGEGEEEGFSVSYTWHRKRVVYMSMTLKELREKARPIKYYN